MLGQHALCFSMMRHKSPLTLSLTRGGTWVIFLLWSPGLASALALGSKRLQKGNIFINYFARKQNAQAYSCLAKVAKMKNCPSDLYQVKN